MPCSYADSSCREPLDDHFISEPGLAQPMGLDKPASSPAALIGIFCLKYALSGNAMSALLELIRLKLDVSGIKNVYQILSSITTAPVRLQSICKTCYCDLDVQDCSDDWLDIIDATNFTHCSPQFSVTALRPIPLTS